MVELPARGVDAVAHVGQAGSRLGRRRVEAVAVVGDAQRDVAVPRADGDRHRAGPWECFAAFCTASMQQK